MRPPAMKQPGWRQPPELKAAWNSVDTVRGLIASPERYEKEQQRAEKQQSTRRMSSTSRDAHKVLRVSGGVYDLDGKALGGRFAKETAPKHKRPKRIPWSVKV